MGRGVSFARECFRTATTKYSPHNNSNLKPKLKQMVGTELYSHTGDDGRSGFDKYENQNLALKAEYADVVRELRGRLQEAISL